MAYVINIVGCLGAVHRLGIIMAVDVHTYRLVESGTGRSAEGDARGQTQRILAAVDSRGCISNAKDTFINAMLLSSH